MSDTGVALYDRLTTVSGPWSGEMEYLPISHNFFHERYERIVRITCAMLDVPAAMLVAVSSDEVAVVANSAGPLVSLERQQSPFQATLAHGEICVIASPRPALDRLARLGGVACTSATFTGITVDARHHFWLGALHTDQPRPDAADRLRDVAALVSSELGQMFGRSAQFLDQASVGVWVLGTDNVVHYVNEHFARRLGWAPHEMIGTPITDHFPPEVFTVARTYYEEARPQQVMEFANVEHRHRDGHRVRVNLTVSVLSRDGTVTGALAIVTDSAESADTSNETANFERFARHSPDILVIFDADKNPRYFSPAADNFGSGGNDLNSVYETIHPDDRDRVLNELDRIYTYNAEPGQMITFRALTRLGEWRYLEARAVDLRHDPDVLGVVVNARDVTDRVLQSDRLAHAARHDHLTKLPNRGFLIDQLHAALARSQRGTKPILVCYLDLDGFKAVNDQYGHATGDQVLASIADRLSSSVRAGDVAGRFGGDEFVIVGESISTQAEADDFTQRLTHILAAPHATSVGLVPCTVTIGAALSQPGDTPDQVLLRADANLYERKRRRSL